jgi:pimeloyl-ACP methyl ester carboxylesterase
MKMSKVIVLLFFFAIAARAQTTLAVQASPSAERGHFAYFSGVKLYYEDCNPSASISVVLLHDGLVHSVTWDDIWEPLCAKYHVMRYDRRGYGRSDAATALFAPEDDLFQLMRLIKMDRAIMVGNSSGAGLALDFAIAHPDMTEGLFLIGPVVHGMPSSAYFLERGNRANAPLAQNDVKAAAENWSRDPYLISGANPGARKKLFDALARNPQNLKSGGQFETRPSPPTVLRLSHIQAPALVLIGEADIADVIAYAGAIEAALPIVSFEVWKNCGHLVQLEKPADLVSRFQRFAALADRHEASVPSTDLRDLAGEYKFFDRTIAISLKNNRLWIGLPDIPDKPLFAASNSHFFVRSTDTEFQFERDAAGKVVKLIIFNADGNKIECPRA